MKLITTLIAILSLCAFAGAASTTQPTIHVRDCTTNTDTAVTVTTGQTLYLSQLPAKWTLDYDFGLAAGHTAQTAFAVDLGKVTACYQPPYCPENRAPLALAVGAHTVYVTVNAGSTLQLKFNLANAPPPAVPTAQIATATLGENLLGANYPSGDFVMHPQLTAAGKSLGLVLFRDWEEEPELAKVGDTYWTNHRKIRAAGFRVALQIQMPGKQLWADNGAGMAQRVIAGKATDVVFLGNEFNTVRNLADPGTYFLGGDVAATKYCATAGPLFTAAGIAPVAPSRVNDYAGIVSRYKAGQYAGLKAVDLHLYSGDENWLAAQFKQFDAFCAGAEIQGYVSEWNLRMKPGETLQQWGVRLAVVMKAIRSTGLTVLHFSVIPTQHPQDDVTALLDGNYQPLSLSVFKVAATTQPGN
jgi:hypothetical protein